MRAKNNPGDFDWEGMSFAQIARAYGITESEFRQHDLEFLNCEGYEDDGTERATLHEWLIGNERPYIDNTPWQKGDDWDI